MLLFNQKLIIANREDVLKRETYLDKEVGYKFVTEEKAITHEDLEAFYNLLEVRETLFTDDEFTRSLELDYKGKIVAGMFLVMMTGKLELTVGMAFDALMVGMNDVKFVSAAYPGDRLRLEGELVGKRTTSKGHVLADWKWTMKNQDNTVIATGVNTELFPKVMTS